MSSKKTGKSKDTPSNKKRAGKKTSQSAAAKRAAGTTSKKKKAAGKKSTGKKAVSKKTATRKTTPRKTASKAGKRKKAVNKQAAKSTAAGDNSATDESIKSLSWMSARANSALKAVQENQAAKGQAVLEKTRKQTHREKIDDDSLIEIAAAMPVDDHELVNFAQEDSETTGAPQTDTIPVESPSVVTPTADSNKVESEIEQHTTAGTAFENTSPCDEINLDAATPDENQPDSSTIASTAPPPPPVSHASPWPARVGVLLVLLVLAFLFRPDNIGFDLDKTIVNSLETPNNTTSPRVASQASEPSTAFNATAVDTPQTITAVAAPPAPAEKPAGTLTSPADSPTEPTVTGSSWQPSFVPQTEQTALQTGTTTTPPEATASTTPDPQADSVASPPATTPPSASPPAQPGYQRPNYGYYPQTRPQQPGYRPYYYR